MKEVLFFNFKLVSTVGIFFEKIFYIAYVEYIILSIKYYAVAIISFFEASPSKGYFEMQLPLALRRGVSPLRLTTGGRPARSVLPRLGHGLNIGSLLAGHPQLFE